MYIFGALALVLLLLAGRLWLRRLDQRAEAFRLRVLAECEKQDFPRTYKHGAHIITLEENDVTISDGTPTTFRYSSVYLISKKSVPDSGIAWVVHWHADGAPRTVGLTSFGRDEGELAMRVIARRAGVESENLD